VSRSGHKEALVHKPLAAVIFVVLVSPPHFAQKPTDARHVAAVKAAVEKLGVGTTARVRVTRVGKPKVKGFINEIRDDDFVVISTEDGSIGDAITISYGEVVKIKGKGVDWGNAGVKTAKFGLTSLSVMLIILRGQCFGPISRCSP
jgi:hypothetical protein